MHSHGAIVRSLPTAVMPMPTHLEHPELLPDAGALILRIPLLVASATALSASADSSELSSAGHRRAHAFSFSLGTLDTSAGGGAWEPLAAAGTPSASRALAVSRCRVGLLRPTRVVRSLSGLTSPGGTHARCAECGEDRISLPADGVCAICFEVLASGEMVQPMLRCGHCFHQACVDALLEARRGEGDRIRCPLCRDRLLASSLSEMPEAERGTARPHRCWPSSTSMEGFPDGAFLGGSLGGSLDGPRGRLPTMLLSEI